MADPVRHFFQPLLPGFNSHIEIPLTFFSDHIERRNERNTVKLRSDACEKTWKVKLEGRRLTVGWNQFAGAHNFQIGDVIIFRHQEDMVFHVTGFGPSCCEIQYTHAPTNENDDDEEDMRNLSKSSCNGKGKTGESSQSENQFVTLTATPASLKSCQITLPKMFFKVNGLENAGGKKITMLDKCGVKWHVYLGMDNGNKRMRLGLGLREFFEAIDIKAYESFVLELVWEDTTTTPMLKFCSKAKTQL